MSLCQTPSVCRNNKNYLTLSFTAPAENVALYWTKDNDVKTKERYLITQHAVSPYELEDPLHAEQRIYFILEHSGQPVLFAERTLPVSGLNNFRDFGGYPAAEGKTVKWGMLFRSNHLYNLDRQALAYIQRLNIQSIIDYRSENEIAKSPNDHVGEKRTYHLNATAQTAELAAQFSAEPSNEDRALIESVIRDIPAELINGRGEQVLEQYRNFVTSEKSKRAFKHMIDVLLDPHNAPNIQHCRGGKDRTGYGVLLALSMLGVSEEDIIADYMVTQANRMERNAIKMDAYRKITNDEDVLAYLHTLIDTRESFIIEVFNTIKAHSGSVANYICSELGFSQQAFDQMRQNYLTDD
ncbi:protein tyrosine phosphatase [Raoultella ornithinolytica]|uniref:Protein tyrosine phosphatase n=1 Tax=Raoultella ornithinolytica TaxID=54291 RepID=A0ABD7QMA2_RAOOR|nr:protein tyrosine phosphatase [Raoultella ornithinolytica]